MHSRPHALRMQLTRPRRRFWDRIIIGFCVGLPPNFSQLEMHSKQVMDSDLAFSAMELWNEGFQ
jgi:hypothetical protein